MSSLHVRRNSTESIRIISRSIRADQSVISKDEANDMRGEYLKIMDDKSLSFEEKTRKISDTIVFPVYLSLGLKPTEESFTFDIVDKKHNQITTKTVTSNVIYLGRNSGNNVVLSNDRNISRIQAYIFVAGDKIVILDIWSICGTYTMQRGRQNQAKLSTVPRNRCILLFHKTEIIHINAANRIDILITPQHAKKKQLNGFKLYKYIKMQKEDKLNEEDEDTKQDDEEDAMVSKPLTEKQQQFKDWLCDELDLSEYYAMFIKKGFDEMKVVAMMSDKDLEEIGIDKKGSRWKILLYLKKVNENDEDQKIDGQQNEKEGTMTVEGHNSTTEK
eukprot:203781_1